NAATSFLVEEKARARLIQHPVQTLVSIGINTLGPLVAGLVEKFVGNPQVTALVKDVVATVSDLFGDPEKLEELLKKDAAQMFRSVSARVLPVVQSLMASVVKDPTLKGLADEGLKVILDFVAKMIASKGQGIGGVVKESLVQVIPKIAKVLRPKLIELFPANL